MGFAMKGNDLMIDHIPLAEIESVRAMDALEGQDIDRNKFSNALMITTIPQGHNSGRTYYLQAESAPLCTELVAQLAKVSRSARKRAEAKTQFAKSQFKVREIFESPPFQLVSALLIISVRALIIVRMAVEA